MGPVVAVAGAGFSGTVTAAQILRRCPELRVHAARVADVILRDLEVTASGVEQGGRQI